MQLGSRGLVAAIATLGLAGLFVSSTVSQAPGDTPVLPGHIDQSQIENNRYSLADLVNFGRFLFTAKFNKLDGFGRPAATGDGNPTKRIPDSAPFMIRTSGPDAGSCASCHNDPEAGGSGDFVANVFVLAQVRDPVVESISSEFSNERNTLGMHGSGAIEMLAREMTADMHAIRADAIAAAKRTGQPVTRELRTKDVYFGKITAKPDGSVDTSQVEGVDPDLIIKPFHQKGVVNSVRVFTVNAFNHHHGMQAVERFGMQRTGEADFDEDGVTDELSVGDITAATIFQVALAIPQQVMPKKGSEIASVVRGQNLFEQIGCADCHRPALILNNPVYSEPNPYNPPGNLRPQDVRRSFQLDLTKQGLGNRLERLPGGKAIVRAYTDLKRHVICDEQDPFFANERLVQGGVPLDQFITRKLWDVGNSGPWGHRGDCMSIGEAIVHHAGEARPSREKYLALTEQQRRDIVNFLKTLQVVPPR
ncbi:MAG: hypothetical protein HRF45_06230 [Fimbriimonadia bacterium]|jgi:hypothetical protein